MAQLYWPFDPSRITEGYGWAAWRNGVHDGIDFGVGQGTELRATVSGVVRNNDAGVKDGAGVDITTDDGWKVRHWHVSEFLVANGARVEAGQVIARTGGAKGTWGAGFSTGPHLHWGVKTGAGWVDPATLGPIAFGSTPTPSAPTVGGQGEGIRAQGSDWTYWVPGTDHQRMVQEHLAERGYYSGPMDGDLASDASVRAIKMACGELGYFDLTYLDGVMNKNLCYGMLLLAQNHGGYSGFNNLFTDGHVWAAFDTGVVSAIAIPTPPPAEAPPAAPVEPVPAPEPEPTPKPVVTPSVDAKPAKPSKPKKEKPVTKPISEKKQQEMIAKLPAADLGVIIPTVKGRKTAYAIYMVIALIVGNIGVGFAAAGVGWPVWLVVAVAITNNLAVPFGALAIANATSKK